MLISSATGYHLSDTQIITKYMYRAYSKGLYTHTSRSFEDSQIIALQITAQVLYIPVRILSCFLELNSPEPINLLGPHPMLHSDPTSVAHL